MVSGTAERVEEVAAKRGASGNEPGALYPFTSRFLEVDGGAMHYLDEGVGPPIVMLHGNPTWSFYFRELVKGLRDQFRVIVPDHIGCGLSAKPRQYPYTLSQHIENVTQLIEHLDLNDVTLAVHDWGGAIGFGWAVGSPERISRLVVFNTAAFLGGRMPFRIRVCRWPVVGEIAILGLNGFARAALRMATARPERMTAAVRHGYLQPYVRPAHRIAQLCFVRDIPAHPGVPSYPVVREIEGRLAALRNKPMLICWGMKDWCFTPKFLDEWVRRFPEAEVHRFADAGHYVVEDAHERILPIVRRFLSS
jgi:haloalkane dehalogenase